jgi:hypothetical protein
LLITIYVLNILLILKTIKISIAISISDGLMRCL